MPRITLTESYGAAYVVNLPCGTLTEYDRSDRQTLHAALDAEIDRFEEHRRVAQQCEQARQCRREMDLQDEPA